jgi:hypothetical protein
MSTRKGLLIAWAGILLSGVLWVMAGAAAAQRGGAPDAARALAGAIDIHVHSLPDDRPRSVDAIEVAKLSRERGMRAIVLKDHYQSTAGIAFLVREVVPDMAVFGGIDLNLPVGGMNPAAVEHMTRVTGGWGRMVWMSTFDAENQVRYNKQNRPFVAVSRGGDLLPEVKQVIALIAKHNLVLATGHVTSQEGLMMLREGRRVGVKHMVVTHAINPPVLMTVAQMQEAAKLGAFVEFVGGSMVTADAEERMTRFADAIRKIGPAATILSSDLGQQGNALPPDGFGAFLMTMRAKGFTEQEVDQMAKQNPARLLGLP